MFTFNDGDARVEIALHIFESLKDNFIVNVFIREHWLRFLYVQCLDTCLLKYTIDAIASGRDQNEVRLLPHREIASWLQ
jgi:hypothetical protein